MDSESTRLLWDLRAALLQALTESREMRRILDRLRDGGWSAYVVIDEAGEGSDDGAVGISSPEQSVDADLDLSGTDRSFLRSLGIDPGPEPHGI